MILNDPHVAYGNPPPDLDSLLCRAIIRHLIKKELAKILAKDKKWIIKQPDLPFPDPDREREERMLRGHSFQLSCGICPHTIGCWSPEIGRSTYRFRCPKCGKFNKIDISFHNHKPFILSHDVTFTEEIPF